MSEEALAAKQAAPRKPLGAFVPSKTNPQSRMDPAKLTQLADSIKKFGVLQPILVRPVRADTADGQGEVLEIVAGERRWRASAIAGAADIPYVVRELTLLEALELQAVENFQRQDLHPLEEAEVINHLLKPPTGEPGFSVAYIAAALDRSEKHITDTAALIHLVPPGRDAYLAKQLTKGTALLIARMPVSIQPKALPTLLAAQEANKGHLLTEKQASELLQAKFMLRLKAAPFRPEDDTLVPAAGSCQACPKRTGANPDLFSDVPQTDTCTDPDCYAGKVAADLDRRCNGARQMGQQVLRGDDALALLKMGTNSDELGGDYVYLDKPAPALTDEPGPLNTVLKGFTAPVLIVHPERNTLRPIATVDTVKKELAARDKLRAAKKPVGEAMSPATTKTPGGKKAQQAAANDAQRLRVEIERQVRQEIWDAISMAITPTDPHQPVPGLTRAIRQRLAICLSTGVNGPALELICGEFLWKPENFKKDPAAEKRRLIGGLDDQDLDAFITLALPLFENELEVHDHWSGSPQPEHLLAIANSPEFAQAVDVPYIRQQVANDPQVAAHAQEGAAPATKPAKKSASKPAITRKKASSRNVSPPPAGESQRAPEDKKKLTPAASRPAKAPQGKKVQAPTAQANEGPPHWVGQFVRMKGAKTNMKVAEITAKGVLILHPVDVAWPLPKQVRKLSSSEVVVLEGQVAPAEVAS